MNIIPYRSQTVEKNNNALKDITKTLFGFNANRSGIEIDPHTHSLYIPHTAMYYDSMPRQYKDITRHASYCSALSGPQKEMVCILKDMIESVGADLPIPAPTAPSKDSKRVGTSSTTWQSVLNFFFKKDKSAVEANDHDSCSSDEDPAARNGVNSERTVQNNVLPDVLWFGTKVIHQGQVRIFLAAMRSMTDQGEHADRQYLPTIVEEESSTHTHHHHQLTYKTEAKGIASAMRVSMISFVPVSSHAVAASTSEHPLNPIANLL